MWSHGDLGPVTSAHFGDLGPLISLSAQPVKIKLSSHFL